MNAIFHGRYEGGSLPEAGSGIGGIRETARERNKTTAGRVVFSRVYSLAKKTRPYLIRDGERD